MTEKNYHSSSVHLDSKVLKMKRLNNGEVIGMPVDSVSKAIVSIPSSSSYGSCKSKQRKAESALNWMNKFGKKADRCTQGIREHVKMGPKISETVKAKLRFGARILQAGGIDRIFRRLFGVEEGEKLINASQCYLSTSAGPIAGVLFTSTEKIAFHSDRPLTLTSPQGEVTRIPYKVLIPMRKVKKVSSSENINKPKQKYMQIVTADDFEFWFLGFVSCRRSVKHLQMVMSQT